MLIIFDSVVSTSKKKDDVAKPHASFMSLSIREIMLNLCIDQMLLVV